MSFNAIALGLLALSLGLVAAACGGGKKPTAHYTTTPPTTAAATPAPALAVHKGMTMKQVRALAGKPQVAGNRCWLYRFTVTSSGGQTGGSSGIDGMRFCFTNGRVSLVQTAQHG
jgi:hypothetical protein